MKLFMTRVGNIQYKKIGKDKYELLSTIKLLPINKILSEKELESIFRVFDNGFFIKIESERGEIE